MEEGQMTEMNLDSMRELMLRIGDSLKTLEGKVQSPMPTFDASNKEVIKEISNEIRQSFFRKKDNTSSIVGSVFGVIALISAMTAIIQPMNRSITELRKETIAVEERIERRLNLKNLRILRLEEGDKEDKRINAIVEILFDDYQKETQ